MSGAAPAASAAPARRGTRLVAWLLLAVGVVLVALASGPPDGGGGESFEPDSTSPGGTRALVELLDSFGAEVTTDRSMPRADTDVAVLFVDELDVASATELEAWVRQGGTLVVADPFSRFTPRLGAPVGGFAAPSEIDVGFCDLAQLSDLGTVEPGGALTFEREGAVRTCFGTEREAFVVESVLGSGRIVAVGGGGPFTNELLGTEDNAAFVTRLTVPAPGTTVVLVRPGGGVDGEVSTDRSLSDVASTGAKLALVQLALAFVVYAWHRSRRLGRPVLEPQPVEIAGSELVVAVGHLLHQANDPGHAAQVLRTDLRRRLGERLGVPPATPPEVLVDVVVARTAIDEARARHVLVDEPVNDDGELLELARAVEALRQEVLGDR